MLGALPADFPIPILLVQHMGAPFMEGFASWLDGILPLDVAVAREQEIPMRGRVYVAPGDRHLLLSPAGTLQISASPPLASQRPSATLMFGSVAKSLGPRGLGVILTGMGEDGAEGLLEMRQAAPTRSPRMKAPPWSTECPPPPCEWAASAPAFRSI